MLELRSASRLHFGLIELAVNQPNRFGGLGLMIQEPYVLVQSLPRCSDQVPTPTVPKIVTSFATPNNEQSSKSNDEVKRRIEATIEHVETLTASEFSSRWNIQLISNGQLHSGLGFGTQLAASVSALVRLGRRADVEGFRNSRCSDWRPIMQLSEQPFQPDGCMEVRDLARWSGRGKRSAIGLHGFLYGGLIQDFGFEQDEGALPDALQMRPVRTRSQAFPTPWSIVLITSNPSFDSTLHGPVHGVAEERMIMEAGTVANPNRESMLQLSDLCVRAAANQDFPEFVSSLESYMALGSQLFEPVQSGRYRDATIASRVQAAIDSDLRAVGQSSWGPTVFGFAESPELARQSADRLRTKLGSQSVDIVVTRAANSGARWRSGVME